MAVFINETCIGCTACTRVCPVNAIEGEKKAIHKVDEGLCIECGACGRVCPRDAVSDSKGRSIARLKKDQWPRPVINKERCYACENCVAACPADALAMKDENLPLTENYAVLSRPELCVSCGWCVDNCQFDAITLEAVNENN